jgi:hypothetical protein
VSGISPLPLDRLCRKIRSIFTTSIKRGGAPGA